MLRGVGPKTAVFAPPPFQEKYRPTSRKVNVNLIYLISWQDIIIGKKKILVFETVLKSALK